MGDPITWRTVAGNSLENAWRPMAGAVSTFDSGLDRLSKMITDRQDVNQGVADRARNANVQALLDAYAGAKTPEALAALQASGQLDPLKAAIDPRDAALVRGADDARQGAVIQLQQAARDAGEKDFLFKNQGTIAQAAAEAAAGQKDKAMETAKALIGHPIYGDTVAKIVAGDQQVQLFKNTLDDSVTRRETEKANAAAQTSQAATAAAKVPIEQQTANQQGVAQLEGLRSTVAQRLGATNQNIYGTEEGMKAFDSALAGRLKNDPAKVETMGRAVAQAVNKYPELRGLPPDVVLDAVMAHESDFGSGKYNPTDGFLSSSIANDLKLKLKDTGIQSRINDARTQRDDLLLQLQQLRGASEGAVRTAYPGFAAGVDAAIAKRTAATGAPGAGLPGATPAPASAPTPAPAAAPAPAPAPATNMDATMMKRRAAAEQQAVDAGVLKDLSPDVKAFVAQQAADKVQSDAAQKAETLKRADAIAAKQREDYLRRQQQLGAGMTGNDVSFMRSQEAARQALRDAAKKAR